MGKPWIDLFATKQSYVSHVPDGRTYSVDALTTHWGGTWAYAYPPHALLPKILSKIQSEDYIVHCTVNSPSFPSSSVVPNFVKPINRDTSQVTSKQKDAQTTSVACIPFPVRSIVSLCLDIISKSKHQQNIYLTALLKAF